jgi:ubiquinone/menaquinone biosynthesis C-methylase UbiE
MAVAAITKTHEVSPTKMPGHWLLAQMGKRILRPGGRELTHRMLNHLAIDRNDSVVEFAPGLGETARATLAHCPASYIAVERDTNAAAKVSRILSGSHQRCISGTAEQTDLPGASASVVYGEAMLSMQLPPAKARIVAEAARLLHPGGRYGIHELCLSPDDVSDEIRESIAHELSDDIHVGVRPLTAKEWRELLESAGLEIAAIEMAPMYLLEPLRLIRDEGLFQAIRFVWNVATHAAARRRVLSMRKVFRKYRTHLAAISIVAVKRPGHNS